MTKNNGWGKTCCIVKQKRTEGARSLNIPKIG